ncbi:MAG: glycoside hydrolase family 127 protein [Caldilineaceae bacterium]|nr:glycoside hydrolase family 127 protein [Caldilineaceae bacterium]
MGPARSPVPGLGGAAKSVWAPHHTLHKTLMGLWDMYAIGGNAQALEILVKWARWFHRWSGAFSQEQMDRNPRRQGQRHARGQPTDLCRPDRRARAPGTHRALRPPPLLRPARGRRGCAHQHAHEHDHPRGARRGACLGSHRRRALAADRRRLLAQRRHRARLLHHRRADQRRGVVAAQCALGAAGFPYAGALHRLQHDAAGRLPAALERRPALRRLLGAQPVERHPGPAAPGHRHDRLFLPLYAGAEKVWGSPTDDFWCCHGSLVQAHTMYADNIWFEHAGGVTMSQYIPSELAWAQDGVPVTLQMEHDAQLKSHHRPDSLAYTVRVQAAQPVEFSLRLRVPWWVAPARSRSATVRCGRAISYVEIRRSWRDDTVHIILPKALIAVPAPDEPPAHSGFMDGPVVLANSTLPRRTTGHNAAPTARRPIPTTVSAALP